MAYGLLSPDEKVSFWNYTLSSFANSQTNSTPTNNIIWNLPENEHLELLMDFLSNDQMYKLPRSEEANLAIQSFTSDWMNEAINYYSLDDIYNLVFNLGQINAGDTGNPEQFDHLSADCNAGACCCSIGSSMTCPTMVLTVCREPELEISYGTCEYPSCAFPRDFGCGAFGLFECDGGKCYND